MRFLNVSFTILLFYVSAFAQTIFGDKINNFVRKANPSPIALWVFDDSYHQNESTGKTVIQDLIGTHDLSIGGWSDYNALTNSLSDSSPIYQSGKSLLFNGTNNYLYIPDASAGDFNPGTSSFAITGWFKHPTVTDNHRIWSNHGTTDYVIVRLLATSGLLEFRVYDGSNTFVLTSVNRYDDSKYHYFAAVWDKGTNQAKLFIDGSVVASLDISTAISIDLSGNELDVGRHHSGIQYFKGYLSCIKYFNTALNTNELKNEYYLAAGWISKNGGVTREYFEWEQGIASDTIYTAISNYTITANRHAILSFDAYGATGGEILQTWLTGWNGHFSQTVSTQKTRYEIDLGELSFSSDSLYFAVPNAGQTVYIDNVKIEYRPIKKGWSKWR